MFTFEHPSKAIKNHEGQDLTDFRGLPLTDNRRCATLTWDVKQDNVMHGFGGYFDCTLYENEMISIVPSTHSPGMISWFPVFIPIKVCIIYAIFTIKQIICTVSKVNCKKIFAC